MKYLIASDIHGCLPTLEKVLTFYDAGGYDMLVLLGDLLNYGPRNGAPQGLDAMGVADALNARAGSIVAVRGNCDSEVDQMLLHFPMMAPYAVLVDGGCRIFLTHGHLTVPGLGGEVTGGSCHGNAVNSQAGGSCQETYADGASVAILSGHTHLQGIDRNAPDGILRANSGSITFPKGGNPATFLTLEDGTLSVRTLEGQVLDSIKLKR